MPAIAELEDLKKVQKELAAVKKKHPQAFDAIAAVINANKMIGYKNVCKMMQGTTPEELKEPRK